MITGDVFLVDRSQDLAQGSPMVHAPAAPDRFDGTDLTSFYRAWASDGSDERLPLSTKWRTRFLNGGVFDQTEILLWTAPFERIEAVTCDVWIPSSGLTPSWSVAEHNERGEPGLTGGFAPSAYTLRLRAGGDELPVSGSFGSLTLQHYVHCGICSPPFNQNWQGWVQPLHRAEGRFSVGTEATPLEDPCLTSAFPQ